MANFFIGVGGTGQNVALAYYRMAKLCGYEPAKIYIMDSDLSIATNQPSFIPLEPIPVEPCILPLQRNSFRDLFNPKGDAVIDSVMSVLFTSKELQTPIDEGMFGRPSVGSATIMDKILLMDNDNTPKKECQRSDANLANLLGTLQTEGDHCVVICGSAKGGTGAGGVPTLAQYIARNADRTRVKIIVLYFLRHFNILLPTSELKYDEIKNTQLKLNAEAGMCYLADEINRGVDACVLFGLLEPFDVPYREAQKQTEEERFLYLLAGIIGSSSFHANIKTLFPKSQDKIYAYWIPYDAGSNTSNLMVSDIGVYLLNGISVGLDNIPKLAGAVMDFLDIFSKYVNPLPGFSLIPSLVVPNNLKYAIDDLVSNMQSNKKQICEAVANNIREKRTVIESNLEWFKRLLRNENDLANQKPRATVLCPRNGHEAIAITGEGYEKTRRQPMGFIRHWVENTIWNNPKTVDEFVKPLIIGLRKSINKTFLNDVFGDMKFTG